MFIYSATLTAKPGRQQPAMAHVIESREIIEGATGYATSAWMAVTGQPMGSFAISTRVDSIADVIAGHQKLGASVEYAGLAEASSENWTGPAQTGFQRVIGGTGDTAGGSVVSMTTATISGSFGDAIAFGQEVMEHVSATVDSPGILTLSEAPEIGNLTWIFSNEDAEAMAEADRKLQEDTTYLAMYDRAQSLLLPGHTTRTVAVRLT